MIGIAKKAAALGPIVIRLMESTQSLWSFIEKFPRILLVAGFVVCGLAAWIMHSHSVWHLKTHQQIMLRAQSYAKNIEDLRRLKDNRSLVQNIEWGVADPVRKILEQTLSSTDYFDISVFRLGSEILRVARPLRPNESSDPTTISMDLAEGIEIRASYPRPQLPGLALRPFPLARFNSWALLAIGLLFLFMGLRSLGDPRQRAVSSQSRLQAREERPGAEYTGVAVEVLGSEEVAFWQTQLREAEIRILSLEQELAQIRSELTLEKARRVQAESQHLRSQAQSKASLGQFRDFLLASQRLQVASEQIRMELTELERIVLSWKQGAQNAGSWRYFRSLAESKSHQPRVSRLDAELISVVSACEEAAAISKKSCLQGAQQLDAFEDWELSVRTFNSPHPTSLDPKNPSSVVEHQGSASD